MHTDCIDFLAELETWYARPNGQYLLHATRAAIQDLLDTSFGYHILQLGVLGQQPLCHASPIHHRLVCAAHAGAGIGLVADPHELPLESDSIDAIIVHHCLEFADKPHQVLREIQRVLTPQGQLLIIGFNPYSLFGCKTRLSGLLQQRLWAGHRPLSEHRLTDWLHLLGCEVLGNLHLYGLPPIGSGRLRRLMARGDAWSTRHNLPLGGLYIVHATKHVAGMHRTRRMLRKRRARLIGLVPKPATSPTPGVPRAVGPYHRAKADVAA